MSKIDTITKSEIDKEIASLYIARSEGKIIQVLDGDGSWFDLNIESSIRYGHRIKPQTLHQAAKESISYTDEHTQFIDGYHAGAVFGAK